jgi:glutaredoxin-related protein
MCLLYDVENMINLLNDSILSEIVKAMGLPQSTFSHKLIQLIFGNATFRFSKLLLLLDQEIKENGIASGARWLLQYFIAGYDVSGIDLIPKAGPLIIASNHPASYDGTVITACIPRNDYKIIIGKITPYDYLPHLSQAAIFSPHAQNTFGRMQTVRNVIQHLKQGGAILIFPRGGIEPDPAFMPRPDAEFHQWSRSLEIFLKHVPETQILITAVSGVISEKTFKHPITWFRKSRPDKQRLAFMYQIIQQALTGKELFGLQPRVTFGELLYSLQPKNILEEIEHAAKRTLEKHLLLY